MIAIYPSAMSSNSSTHRAFRVQAVDELLMAIGIRWIDARLGGHEDDTWSPIELGIVLQFGNVDLDGIANPQFCKVSVGRRIASPEGHSCSWTS